MRCSWKSRKVQVGAFPISIDSRELDQAARSRSVQRRAREIRAELGNPRKILLGVDRFDYTKGIDVRLKALAELLAEGRVKGDDTVLVQLATPSRERVDSYQKLREDIERQVGHINGEYGEVGHPAVHYMHRPVPRDELIAYFVASDVMLVTPLRDGMNLVAKEYVACRSDLGGALVLSEFTGAAAELRQAYLVNPHDLEGVKDAIEAALNQTDDEGRRRMRACDVRYSPTTSTAGPGPFSMRSLMVIRATPNSYANPWCGLRIAVILDAAGREAP